jgi:hypothetical protein
MAVYVLNIYSVAKKFIHIHVLTNNNAMPGNKKKLYKTKKMKPDMNVFT